MKRFADFVVGKRKILLIVFLVLAVAGAGMSLLTKVNYDMTKYLPKDAETTKAVEVMEGEFGNSGAAAVMTEAGSLDDALEFKKEIQRVKNVAGVLWLDDALYEFKPQLQMIMPDGTPPLSDEAFLAIVFGIIENDPSYSQYLAMIPQEMLENFGKMQSAISQFYKSGKAYYQVTFTGAAFDATTVAAIKEIKALGTVNISGPAAGSFETQNAIKTELLSALMIIVPALIVILILATSSFFDPVILLASIAVAILMNMGTNFLMGSVAYLTNSIAILFQLAISMDYSIFLLHSYKAQRRTGLDPVSSAKAAVRKSLSPVSASSLTTIAGFAAMLFMSYTIGMDMGLVMGKGIIFSLISVFLFMPGLMVICDKAVLRLEHRSFISLFRKKPAAGAAKDTAQVAGPDAGASAGCAPDGGSVTASVPQNDTTAAAKDTARDTGGGINIGKPPLKDRFAGFVIKLRFVLPILLILLIVPAYLAQNSNDFFYGQMASAGGEGSVLEADRTAIEEIFGSQNRAVVLLEKLPGETAEQHAQKELGLTMKLLGLELDGIKYVAGAQSKSLLETMGGVPAYMDGQFESDSYSRIILTVNTPEEGETAFKVADEIRRIIAGEIPEGGYYILGDTITTQDIKSINTKDYSVVTWLTLIFILAILLVTFRSAVLTMILGAVIQAAIWFNMAIPYLLGNPLVFLGYLIAGCVQMGCTIDYGILLSSHYTANRETMGKKEAAKKAFLSSVGAVTTSALILAMVGFTVSITGSTPAVTSIGTLLGVGTLISYFLMMFVLPGTLVILDKPIKWTTLRLCRKKKDKKTGE